MGRGLILLHFCFEFLYASTEGGLDGEPVVDLLAGVHDGAVVAVTNAPAYLCVGELGVFVYEIHRQLASLDQRSLAAFGEYFATRQAGVAADGVEYVVGGKLLASDVYDLGEYAVDQRNVYLFEVVVDGEGHNGVHNALELSHAAVGVDGDVLDYSGGYAAQAVALDTGFEDGSAQCDVGAFDFYCHPPFEAGEHALFNTFELGWGAVAGHNDLPLGLLQLVEDVEEGLLRLGGVEFLYVVDDEDVDGLVEVEEVVAVVVLGGAGVGILRLECVCRHEEHALLGMAAENVGADGRGEVGLSHTGRAIEKEGIEGGLSRIFGNGQGY